MARNLHQIGAEIAERFPEVRVSCEPDVASTDGKAGRLRIPRKGRKGLLLRVVVVEPGPHYRERRVFRHHSGETYRTNSEAEEFLADWKRLGYPGTWFGPPPWWPREWKRAWVRAGLAGLRR